MKKAKIRAETICLTLVEETFVEARRDSFDVEEEDSEFTALVLVELDTFDGVEAADCEDEEKLEDFWNDVEEVSFTTRVENVGFVEELDFEGLPVRLDIFEDDDRDEELVTRHEHAELSREDRFEHFDEYEPRDVLAVCVVARKDEQNNSLVEPPPKIALERLSVLHLRLLSLLKLTCSEF